RPSDAATTSSSRRTATTMSAPPVPNPSSRAMAFEITRSPSRTGPTSAVYATASTDGPPPSGWTRSSTAPGRSAVTATTVPFRRRITTALSLAAPMHPLERLIDLVALLLNSRRPLTFDEIRTLIPAYQQDDHAAAKRMFERDKDVLKEVGIPIELAATDVWDV